MRGNSRATSVALALVILISCFPSPLRAADTNDEQQLIRVLQSNGSPQDKDAACARLKRVGTVRSVPALASLLSDEQLSHSARYALEPMPYPEAGRALIGALEKTSGPTKVGIIDSLGVRGETKAVPALAKLLATKVRSPGFSRSGAAPDSSVAIAAATALGQIGGAQAIKALTAALGNSTGSVHDAVVDGSLRCANHLLASKTPSKALGILQHLYETEKPEHIRIAAYRGMILASGPKATSLLTKAISGEPGASQTAALQAVSDIKLPGATEAFAGLLPGSSPVVQVALIGGLAQRDDPSAARAVAAQVASHDPAVRLAALKALGNLGDASVVRLLAESAASATGDEQKAARQSLVDLRRGKIMEMLLSELTNSKVAVQAELARALGDRGDKAAMPKLLQLAQTGPESARKAALKALALLADEPQIAALVNLVTEAKDEAARSEAAEALNAVCQRLLIKRGRVDVAPLVKAMANGSPKARIALLLVCSGLNDPQVRSALRNALADSDPQVRAAAIRALCDTTDVELLGDLLKVACQAPEENLRSLAIRGCVRVTTQEESIKLPNSERVGVLRAILATPLRDDQKRVVLAGLAEIPDLQSLKLVEPLLDDAAVQSEAAQAVIKIAPALPNDQAQLPSALLKKVVATVTDVPARQSAEAALNQIQARADFITSWQMAGPYRQAGKDYAALFDTVFPPETASPEGLNWRTMPVGTDPKRPWLMDLLKALGGEQCVAYVRTSIHCEQETPARLEVGADDGVKIWLNGKLIHANNVARGLQPGSDKVNVTLKPGWNFLLLKVTQLNQGWEFCARLLKPAGSHLEGLQFDAARNQVRSARE